MRRLHAYVPNKYPLLIVHNALLASKGWFGLTHFYTY